jgi:hypothetical protein
LNKKNERTFNQLLIFKAAATVVVVGLSKREEKSMRIKHTFFIDSTFLLKIE